MITPIPLDISRIQALCFDLDGTLSDTDDQYIAQLSNWLSPVKFLFPEYDPKPFVRRLVMGLETPGNDLIALSDRLGLDEILAPLGEFLHRIGLPNKNSRFKPIPAALETLEQLKPHFPMAIVTARGARTTQQFIEQFNLGDTFACIASAQTCKHTKPYPDPIFWAAEKIGVAPGACLMVGDTTIDIRAGLAAGAQTVGVLCGFGEEQELRTAGANLILPSPVQLPETLLKP